MKTNKQYKLEAALPHSTINLTTQPELSFFFLLTFILFANQAEAPACYWNPSSWSTHVGELARPREKEMVGLGWEREKKECY